MKRLMSVLLVLLVLTGGLFLLMSRGKKRAKDSNRISMSRQRVWQKPSLAKVGAQQFASLPYRLLPYGADSVVLLSEEGFFVSDAALAGRRRLVMPEGYEKGLYYISRSGSRQVGFSVEKNASFVSSGSDFEEFIPKGKAFNSIWAGDRVYSVSGNRQLTEIFFESVNLADRSRKVLATHGKLFPQLGDSPPCIEQILEGNFFRISDSVTGFYFYRAGVLLTLQGDSIRVFPSVVKTEFPKFAEREIEIGGMKALQCMPESGADSWIQMSACSDGSRIYVLSNVSKTKNRVVDVYDAASLNYLHSFPVEKYRGAEASDILLSNHHLIVSYEKGDCVSYRL